MNSSLRFSAFLLVSAGLHLAILASFGHTGTQAAGGGGAREITLAAVPENMGALIEKWQTPVEAVHELQSLQEPTPVVDPANSIPALARLEIKMPSMSLPSVKVDAIPMVRTQPAAPLRPSGIKAQPSSKPLSEHKKTDPTPQQAIAQGNEAPTLPAQTKPQIEEKARGQAKSLNKGQGASNVETTRNSKRQANLMQRWKAGIRTRIERQKRRATENGKVRLTIQVTTGGKLVSVNASGGSDRLRSLSIAAVKRSRLPRAPNGIEPSLHRFSLTMTYDR